MTRAIVQTGSLGREVWIMSGNDISGAGEMLSGQSGVRDLGDGWPDTRHAGRLTRARNFFVFAAALARIGVQNAPLRRWYLANRLRQISLATDYARRMDGSSSPPRSVSLKVTFLCNARCTMCHYANSIDPDRGQPVTRREGFIDFEAACRLVDDLAPSRTMLSVTGGEPLAWGERIFDLVDYARGRGVPTTITTNGTLLGRHLDRLMASPPDVLCVSVLGPPQVHDRIVGLPAYGRITDALTELLDRKGGDRWRSPLVVTNTVMLPDNSGAFAEVVRLSQRVGACGSSFQPVWFATEEMCAGCHDGAVAADETLASAACSLSTEATAPVALWQGIQRARLLSEQLTHPVFFYPLLSREDTHTYYEHPEEPLRRSRAVCAWVLSAVLPDGTVSPCQGIEAGNLHKERFLQIWNGERMRGFRRRLRAAGMFPICSRCCSLWRNE